MNIFRDFFAGIRDIFGGRSIASQKVLRDARKQCLAELKKEAYEIGMAAVNFSKRCKKSFSVGIAERKIFTKKYKTNLIINNLEDIAGKTKVMPRLFYNEKKFNVTKNFINYCNPLIGIDFPQTTSII